jgi:hypothetical protein
MTPTRRAAQCAKLQTATDRELSAVAAAAWQILKMNPTNEDAAAILIDAGDEQRKRITTTNNQ